MKPTFELIDEFPLTDLWKKYEPEIKDRLAAWKANGQTPPFFKFILAYGIEVDERDGGMVFIFRRPESKALAPRPHFVKWMKYLTGNTENQKL